MEPKKISFGFNRIQKKQGLPVLAKEEDKKQFIDCLEEKSIKLIGHIEEEEEKPLVIPLKNSSTTAASISRIAAEIAISESKAETSSNETPIVSESLPNESLEQQAARELLEDAKNIKKEEVKVNAIPVSNLPTMSGEKESSLEDYESIPITDFGLAMLRGMGWQPGKGIGKKNVSVELAVPKVRPKGMGLGADKMPKTEVANGDSQQPEDELKIVKGACVKIITGKKAGSYGQISGFDEDSGRLIVKMAISGENVNISEFMVQPVAKDEYNRNSRILNGAKYEIYKRKEEDDRRHKHRQRDEDKPKEDEKRKDNNTLRSDDRKKYDERLSDEVRRRDDNDRRKYDYDRKMDDYRNKYDYDRRSEDDRRRKDDKRRRDH